MWTLLENCNKFKINFEANDQKKDQLWMKRFGGWIGGGTCLGASEVQFSEIIEIFCTSCQLRTFLGILSKLRLKRSKWPEFAGLRVAEFAVVRYQGYWNYDLEGSDSMQRLFLCELMVDQVVLKAF
jgi:hypothetical protein